MWNERAEDIRKHTSTLFIGKDKSRDSHAVCTCRKNGQERMIKRPRTEGKKLSGKTIK